MEIKEVQEVVHEVVSELDNIPNFNGALRHREIDWLIENLIKFAIIKALPLDEKEDCILSFMPWCQITGTFDIMTSMLMLYNYVLHLYLSFYIANYVLTNMICSVALNIMFSSAKKMWRNSCAKANAIRKFGIILEVGLILWLDFAWIQVFLVLLHYWPMTSTENKFYL